MRITSGYASVKLNANSVISLAMRLLSPICVDRPLESTNTDCDKTPQ